MNRHYQLYAVIGLILLSLALIRGDAHSQEPNETPGGFVRLVRESDLDELGIGRAFGFTYSPVDGAFLFLSDDLSPPSGPSAVTFEVLSTLEQVVASRYMPVTLADAANAVFDSRGNRFLLLDSAGDELTEIGANSLGRPLWASSNREAWPSTRHWDASIFWTEPARRWSVSIWRVRATSERLPTGGLGSRPAAWRMRRSWQSIPPAAISTSTIPRTKRCTN
jgi:hypothetical protein